MKHQLQMRLAIAGFLQETLQEMASKRAQSSEAHEVIKFIEKARLGEPLPNESVIRIASLFKDEFTLANIPRPQLVSMCQYMGLHPYGADSFLRFQLRNKFRVIKEDDKRILWEGIDSLSIPELREACQVRGMRAHGLPSAIYIKQLKEWLDLSIQKNIPISLLIMSRAFTITTPLSFGTEEVLKSSLSSLDSDTINEVVLAAASSQEEKTMQIQKRKLESLNFQQEMIAEERAEACRNNDAVGATDTGSATKIVSTKNSKELSAAEIEALGDSARQSGVLREKKKLAIIEANMDVDRGPDGSDIHRDTSGDLSSSNKITQIRSILNNMIDKLRVEVDVTEKALGDKFHFLDRDRDGELSAAEIKDAIVKIFKRSCTEDEIDEFIAALDKDKDGKVSVVELIRYAEEIQRKEESVSFQASNKKQKEISEDSSIK